MAAKYKGQDLLTAVSEMNCEKLVEFSTQNKSKKSPLSFKSLLNDLTAEEIDQMWEELSRAVVERTEAMFLADNKSREHSNKQMCLDLSYVIQTAIDLAFAIFEQSMPASQGLLHMVVFLNRIIFEIPSSLENLKNNIALLCERMFHLNYLYQDHELITFNTFIYLLKRSLYQKAAKKDVKRLYALRSLIPKIISMEDVDANEMWNLFRRCATSSLYLTMTEGQKILSLALTTDVDHVNEIHEAIKQRLPSCSLAHGAAYGKIYFDAWNLSVRSKDEGLKNELEIACLQDLILLAVHGRQKQLVLILRKLLSQFHSQKKEVYVSKMLYFLYQPILWRYLKSPDGLIRANAAQIFLDVFPLEDPDVKIVTTDIELNDQMLIIKDLLLDDFPIVRSATIIGLCITMSVNWELFPEDMLKTYFKIMINELSCDSSSTEVRCAVAKGFKVVLENPLSIMTLGPLLPSMKGLFHDIADSVRISFCQLLLKVKKISAVKYYDIVPLDHLLARMEEDPTVAKLIVNLIHNSYFPKSEGPESWLARCVEMVKADRGASRVFFQYISNFIGLESTAHFMIQTVKAIHFYVKSKVNSRKIHVLPNRPSKDDLSFEGDDLLSNTDALEEAAGFHDPHVVSGLLDAVAILWLSSLTHLEKPENKKFLKMIVARLSKCLGDLSLYYKDTPVWQSVYYLSSFMPSLSIPSLASLCFLRLKTLGPHARPEEYMTLLECLCNQNESANLLLVLKEWIEVGFSQSIQPPAPKKRKTKKNSKNINDEINCAKPLLGVQMLNAVIDQRSCQKVLVARHPDTLKGLLQFVDDLKRKIELSYEKNLNQDEMDFVTDLLFALLKISVLLQGEDKFNAVKFIEELLLWVQEKVLKPMLPDTTLNSSSTRRSMIRKNKPSSSFDMLALGICKDLCTIMTDMTLLGFLNVKSLKFIKFAMKLLSLDGGGELLLPVSKLLYKHISYGIYLNLENKEVNILRIMPDCYNKVIQCLNKEQFLLSIPTVQMKDIQALLAGSLLQMHPYSPLKELVSSVTSSITKSILNSILNGMESWEVITKEHVMFENIKISKSGAFLLSTVCMKPKMIVYFLQQLQKYLAKTARDIQSWVACCVIVLNIGEIKNMSKGINKEMECLLGKLEGLLQEHQPPLKAVDTNILLQRDSQPVGDEDLKDTNKSPEEKELSFEEHCQREYKKLKDLLLQKASVT